VLVVITGGGTGGHIYPALEVGRALREGQADIEYLGSNRGQEGSICGRQNIPFTGFESRPLYSLRTSAGWKSLMLLLRATAAAKKVLKAKNPDLVFSTGGYSAAPVMAAARSLRIPYTIHDTNSVPGRSNRIFASKAAAFTCTFHCTVGLIPGAVRTGQPIRRELRAAAQELRPVGRPFVIGVGGSQGSQFINETLPPAAGHLKLPADVLLATGRNNFDSVETKQPNVRLVPYLETDELVDAYRKATVAVARSGGAVAEFALFGLPSVLIPLPTSADSHQLRNAEEFAAFGGAILLEQRDASPLRLAEAIDAWHTDEPRQTAAREALRKWDAPDATDRIVEIILRVGTRHN
jgi:UDP-N-acetylglucosamine--N-acetylmuramyl-(pentapeptide) pyrophosphoryl-undecaprenol N-acetylglucosamine transferase